MAFIMPSTNKNNTQNKNLQVKPDCFFKDRKENSLMK